MPLQNLYFFLIIWKLKNVIFKKQVYSPIFFILMTSCFFLPDVTEEVVLFFVVDFVVGALIHKFHIFYFVNELYYMLVYI